MAGQVLFETQRSKVIRAFQAAGQPFIAGTKPYESTQTLVGGVVNVLGVAPNQIAFLVFPQQTTEFFSYGVGDAVLGFGAAVQPRPANDADTNLAKGRSTNGAEDFVIEGISLTCRAVRMSTLVPVPGVVDLAVAAAFRGELNYFDPGSLFAPPQLYSPFNLEDAIPQAVIPQCSIELEWDRERVIKVGTLEEFPEGGGKSYLRSNGEPSSANRYRIPEGYLWRRDGQPDSEFVARATLRNPIVIPLNFAVDVAGTGNTLIQSVGIELKMRLHGMAVKLPSRN
jgi:hypothetical protein